MLRMSLLVGLGGFAGSCLRYWAGLAGVRLAGVPTSWATAFVNVTGCFAIGVLGGYTTFSTFGYETFALFEQGRTVLALANAGGQLAFGLLAVFAGMAVARGMA